MKYMDACLTTLTWKQCSQLNSFIIPALFTIMSSCENLARVAEKNSVTETKNVYQIWRVLSFTCIITDDVL